MKFELEVIEDVSELTVVSDSTGFKMTDAGGWINYLKVHVAIDSKTWKLIEIVVTDRDAHDS